MGEKRYVEKKHEKQQHASHLETPIVLQGNIVGPLTKTQIGKTNSYSNDDFLQ